MGPVMPVLAALEFLKSQGNLPQVVWYGSRDAERDAVMPFVTDYRQPPTWKLRREASWRAFWLNATDPFRFLAYLPRFVRDLRAERPSAIVSAGGFLGVPLAYAARLFGRVPLVLYHQDMSLTLSSRLLAPIAAKILVNQARQADFFPGRETAVIPHPLRAAFESPLPADDGAVRAYGLDPAKPLVIAMGGGTGALGINRVVTEELFPHLRARQASYALLHLAGGGKRDAEFPDVPGSYAALEFLPPEKLAPLVARASVVISRGGWGALAELGHLGKAAFVIPLPDSPQLANVAYFSRRNALMALPESGEWQRAVTKAAAGEGLPDIAAFKGLFPGGGAARFGEIIRSFFA